MAWRVAPLNFCFCRRFARGDPLVSQPTHPHTAQARDVHAKLSFTPQHRIPLHNGRVCSRLPLPRGRARRLRSAQVRETRNPDSLNPETSRPRSP